MQPQSDTADKTAPPLSRGERLFNWLVYGGIAGLGTFIATIPVAYWAKYGGGAKHFEHYSAKLRNTGLSAHTTEQVMMTTATMQGGNLAVLPIKWAEDNKVALVTKINDMLGDKTDLAALENEDKQTWGSIIKARVVAWVTVFASLKTAAHVLGEKTFSAFENGFAKHVVCKPLGKPTHLNGQETKAFKFGKIGAIDVFATVAASTLLYFGSRIFAHWDRQKNPPETDVRPAVPSVPHESGVMPELARATSSMRYREADGGYASAVKRHAAAETSVQMGA